jgi:ankyrin repeat protein
MPKWFRQFAAAGGLVVLVLVAPSVAEALPQLADAIRRGQTEQVRALLKRNVNVNEKLPDGTTALHWAVERDDAELVGALMDAKADPNVVSAFGVTPLALACRNGNAAIVSRLVRATANPNTAGRTGEPPLMTAARTGRPEVVRVLLEAGADLNAKEPHAGQTALMWAIAEGHSAVVKMLLGAGASPRDTSKRGFTPLLFAARNGDTEITQILLDHGIGVNDASQDGTTALVIATIRSHVDYARFLLRLGADPNLGPGFTPIHWVAGDWSSELAGEKTAVRPEGTEWDRLLPLEGQPRLDFIKVLLDHGADINSRAKTVPRASVGTGAAPGPGGVASSARGGGRLAGATAFFMAAQHAELPLMRFLLANGADPNLLTGRNVSPLMAAAGVDSGESIGYTGVKEEDALEAVKLCLELGNDVNTLNSDGENALHGVAYRGNAGGNKLAALLIEKNIAVDVKNKRGWTPVTLAEGIYTQNSNSKNQELERLLLAHGGKPSPPGIERDAYAVIAEETPQQ